MAPIPQSQAGGILEWLKQQFLQRQGGTLPFSPAAGIGAGMYGEPATPVTPTTPPTSRDPRLAGITPQAGGGGFGRMAQGWVEGMGGGMGGGGALPPVPQPPIFQPQAAPGPIPLPGMDTPGGIPGGVSPQTKTEPRSPLRFSWGANDLENYTGQDILQMKGAPTGGREGFMGVEPSDPMRSGSFVGPSGETALEQYMNTANPAGFSGFHELPETEAIARAAVNPNWQEVENIETTERERGEQARQTQTHQAGLIEEAQNRFLKQTIGAALSMAQAEKGGQPLTQEEIDEVTQRTIYQQSQAGGLTQG